MSYLHVCCKAMDWTLHWREQCLSVTLGSDYCSEQFLAQAFLTG